MGSFFSSRRCIYLAVNFFLHWVPSFYTRFLVMNYFSTMIIHYLNYKYYFNFTKNCESVPGDNVLVIFYNST